MKKVIEIFNVKKTRGDIGIEIEVEGKGLSIVDNAIWTSVRDDSLDGIYGETCCEYVLTTPVPIDRVSLAMKALAEELKAAEFNFSHRTSTHVHVNVQELTSAQLLNMMYLYYLFEKSLVAYSGPSRIGNNFCLRLVDAEGVLQSVSSMFLAPDSMNRFVGNDTNRYAAMNIESLRKYGSLEFRSMEGTMDVDWITTWANLLHDLRDAACKYKDVLEIAEIANLDALKLAKLVFGKDIDLFDKKQLVFDMREAQSLTMDLLNAYQRGLEDAKKKPVKEEKKYPHKIGEFITHDQAVEWTRLGGKVKNNYGADRGQFPFIVSKYPVDVVAEILQVEVEPPLVIKNNLQPAW